MENKLHEDNLGIVPENTEGKPLDIEESIIKKSIDEASDSYQRMLGVLLEPGSWETLNGFSGASFKLQKINSQAPDQLAGIHDHIQIDIAGPEPHKGDGFDWVEIERIDENFDENADESFGMRLRASSNPEKANETATAHFFSDKATSTFIIKRNGKTITMSYHGRNEVPNVKDMNVHDKIRNSIVSLGALSGLSSLEWTSFIKGILKC